MLTRVRQETNVVERLVSRWVSSLHNTLTTGAVTATQDTTLGVDIQQLTAAKRTFEDMANREQNSMLDWCKTHPNPPPSDPAGVDALVKAIDLRERQLGKELVLQLLTDAPSSSAGDLEFLYKGVAEVCR
jgi:hypothetical protein